MAPASRAPSTILKISSSLPIFSPPAITTGTGQPLTTSEKLSTTSRIDDLYDICAEFSTDPGGDFYIVDIEFIFYFWPAGVHHRNKRHLPFDALFADKAQLFNHFSVGRCPEVDMNRDGIGAEFEGFFDGADKLFCRAGRGSGRCLRRCE